MSDQKKETKSEAQAAAADEAKDNAAAKDSEKKGDQPSMRNARTPLETLHHNVLLLERVASRSEKRLILRVLRRTATVRNGVASGELSKVLAHYLPEGTANRTMMLEHLAQLPSGESETGPVAADKPQGDEEGDAEMADATGSDGAGAAGDKTDGASKSSKPRDSVCPEVETYFHLLVNSRTFKAGLLDLSEAGVTAMLARVGEVGSHSLNLFRAKAHAIFSRIARSRGPAAYAAARPVLLTAYRTACLRHDEFGQATLLNLVLGNFLSQNLYDQASKLIANASDFPITASNNQFVRYLYYRGRIEAVQCEYTDSYVKLSQALRKTPQRTARGFRIIVQQLACIVQLLMGEVPERSVFNAVDTRQALLPYLELTQAVRQGALSTFSGVVTKHADRFRRDGNYLLIQRLRHSVIKTGLRNISLSYSRISFDDICAKLRLESANDAEYICAKAIRDGVIDAKLDHDTGSLISTTSSNVYTTVLPQQAFHDRISFCMEVRNEAVRAMQYPLEHQRKQEEEARKKRLAEEEEELDIDAVLDDEDMEDDE